MKSLLLLIFISLTTFLSAQSKWGVEFKGSRFNTTNSGALIGGTPYQTILSESDLVTSSFSLGIIYRLNDRNLLKFHQGCHRNGRTISLLECDDLSSCYTYTDFKALYHYFQLAPSYVYRLINKRIIIPFEIGINMNMLTRRYLTFYSIVKPYNYSYEISTGLDFRVVTGLIIGLHGLFSGNISDYQSIDEAGIFEPKELGFEFSIMYEFGKTKP